MKKVRFSMATALTAAAIATGGTSSAADDSATRTTRVSVVDFESIPQGKLPSLPEQGDGPQTVAPGTQPADITATVVVENRVSKKSALTRHVRAQPRKIVELAETSPGLGAMYVPSPEQFEIEGEAPRRLQCGDHEGVTPVRWETLRINSDGNARLEFRDLWFDGKSCVVGPGTTSSAMLKAIAWEDGRPWLFAMRTEGALTLLMPKSSDLSTEAMVGHPITVRGDFTRITLPLGRWGSSSVVANLPSLALGTSAGDGDRSIEVGVELVQTMAEKSPTLLIRTHREEPESDANESNE